MKFPTPVPLFHKTIRYATRRYSGRASDGDSIGPGATWGRRLLQGAGLLVLSAIAGGLVSLAAAQNTKKTNPPKNEPKEVIADVLATPYGAEQVAYINAEIEKKWKENKIEPSERCSRL